jgi:hypothetical protein
MGNLDDIQGLRVLLNQLLYWRASCLERTDNNQATSLGSQGMFFDHHIGEIYALADMVFSMLLKLCR